MDLFPELRSAQTDEFQAYWQTFSTDRASMHPETPEEKEFLKTFLQRKREDFMKRQSKKEKSK